MMFGAPGVDVPGPQASGPGPGQGLPNRTVMFGAVQAPSAPTPAPAQSAPNRTMMFGAADAPQAPAPQVSVPNRTMMFGAADVPQAPAPQVSAPNRTMMFGAPGGDAPAPVAAPSQPNRTVMFGAVQPPTPEPAKPASSTMMFGAVPAPAPAPSRPASSTMMFGATPTPAPVEPPKPAAGSTMMFGAVQPGTSAVAGPPVAKGPKPPESTVRLGPEELDKMMREHDASRAPTLPPDGGRAPGGGAAPSAPNRTMMFGAPAAADPMSAPATAKATQMFGAVDPAPISATGKSTQMFGQVSSGPVPEMLQPMPLGSPAPGGSVELPPEALNTGAIPMAAQIDDGGEDMAAMLRGQQQRRNRIAMVIIGIVLLGAGVAVAVKALGSTVFSSSTPPELLQASDSALATLRLDDSASKQKAEQAFAELAAKHPDFIQAHAGLVTALALQFDDVQQRFVRLAKAFDEKNNRVARYNKERSPSDWQNKAAALEAEAKQIKEEHDPLVAQAKAIDGKVLVAYKALGDAATRAGTMAQSAELALIRAQAIYHAVYKTDQAIPLIQRYENVAQGKSDGWIDLALAEYTVNAVSSPDSKNEALAKLTALTAHDSTFIRAYVLSGRVNLALKHYADAENDFEKVLTMRKDHDIAADLYKWTQRLKREDEAANPQP